MKLSYAIALTGALFAAGTNATFAGMSSGGVDIRRAQNDLASQTIGAQLASGQLTEAQVLQLIQFTGLDVEKAKQYTVPEVSAMRWTNN